MSNAAVSKDFDVLVLGAGAAGCVAASVIASHGRSVALVGAFGGATAQSSGAVDSGMQHEKTSDALSALRTLASDVALTYRDDGHALLLATEVGTIKSAMMAQATQAFDLSRLPQAQSLAVVGFSGLNGFDAHAVAKMLSWSIKHKMHRDVVVRAVTCEFRADKPWRSSLEMARYVDENSAGFSETLSHFAKKEGGHTTLLIPAVLGRVNYRSEKPEHVFELLAMPHSVPGLRLSDAFHAGIKKQGVSLIDEEVVSAELADRMVNRVHLETRALHGKQVIVATGRFFSGGFTRQGFKREKIFDLPLWTDGKLVEDLPSRQLTTESMHTTQPLLKAALRVDEKNRPYNRMMELHALNLFAAGSGVLSDISLSNAALSGYLSAHHALEALARE